MDERSEMLESAPARTGRRPTSSKPSVVPMVVDMKGLATMAGMSVSKAWGDWSAGKTPAGFLHGSRRKFHVSEVRSWIIAGMPPRHIWDRTRTKALGNDGQN